MNLGELKTAVENVAGQSISDVVRHFNACLLMLASMSRETYSQDVAAVAGTFTIPDNVLSIYSMSSNNIPIVWQRVDEGSTPGGTIPYSAYRSGANVILYPPATCTVTILYKMKPAALTSDAGIPEIVNSDDVLINYAIWQLLMEEENPMAGHYKENYYEALRAWQRINTAGNARPRKIRLVSHW